MFVKLKKIFHRLCNNHVDNKKLDVKRHGDGYDTVSSNKLERWEVLLDSLERAVISTNIQHDFRSGAEGSFLLFKYDGHIPRYNGFLNYGDYIQTYAVQSALQRLFSCNFEFCDRDSASLYKMKNSNRVPLCIMQGWFAHSLNFFPSEFIHPVWLGTHFRHETKDVIKKALVVNEKYFRNPVGCRDLSTLSFLQNEQVPSYFSRCLTLTLPTRVEGDNQRNVYLVDIPEEVKRYLPEEIKENSCEVVQRWVFAKGEPWQITYQKSVNLLSEYRERAKLVITSALHCAAPCVAMGIPVILISLDPKENSTRFSALSGIKRFYTMDDLKQQKIDFDVNAANIEELKVAMLRNLKLSVDQELEREVSAGELRDVRDFIANFSVRGE